METKQTVMINGKMVITKTTMHEAEKRGQKARVYVSGIGNQFPADDVLAPVAKFLGLTSIHTTRGEHPVMDALWDAVNKQHVALDALAVANAFPNLKATFSRKAGCGCGCSPGFILERSPDTDGKDYWIEAVKSI